VALKSSVQDPAPQSRVYPAPERSQECWVKGVAQTINPDDPSGYGSAGPDQKRPDMNEADASAGRRGSIKSIITDNP
jgi:hypothetical protein